MKFNVGDKVRVRNDLVVNRKYGGLLLHDFMTDYLGKEYVVDSISYDTLERQLQYYLCGNRYTWAEEMLEPVEEKTESIEEKPKLIGEKDYSTKYKEVAYKLGELLERKNNDYGNSTKKSFDRLGVISLASRLYDKYNRFEQLAVKGVDQKVNDESVIDTLMDLAGYAIQSAVILEEYYKNKQ